MPRGGHSRGGPAVYTRAERELHGTKTRPRHRTKGDIGTPMIVITPPPHLTASQKRLWAYYAPHLTAEERLPAKARDTLAKYVVGLDMVARLNRKIRSIHVGGEKNPLLGELRQWLNVTRLYENDLLLNPASSVRAPLPPSNPDADEDQELDDILN